MSLDQLAFNVKGLSTVSNEPITVSLSARLNQAGTVTAQGTAKIAPPQADLEIGVSDLDLRPFQPYLNEQARLAITSGRFNTRGRVRYTPPGAGAPLVKFAGELSLTNFVTTDQVLFKEFVKWDALNVTGIDLDLQPNQLQVQEVKWRGLQTSVIIGPDHRPNLKTVLPEKAAGAAATPAAPRRDRCAGESRGVPGPARRARAGERGVPFLPTSPSSRTRPLTCRNSAARSRACRRRSKARRRWISSGKVDAASPFSISGKVNPLAKDLQLDLAVAFTNTDLTAFTTYLEKYAGHPLNKGKLTMGLHYDINQKQLKAENKFLIDHFTLGPRNDSTNATHLPVKLAVALLKDRNGQINLDIPLSGRTDDPQFKIAPLVFKVVLNLIVKAATSPFSLLGALVGGGEELSFVEFQPGRADIPDAEAQKLDKLVKALYERPAVSLEIAGSFDPEQDRAALARLKLEQHLKILRLKELTDAGKTAPSLAALQLEPARTRAAAQTGIHGTRHEPDARAGGRRRGHGYQHRRGGFRGHIGGTRGPGSRRQSLGQDRPEEPAGVRKQRRHGADDDRGQELLHRQTALPRTAPGRSRRRSPDPRPDRSEARFRHPGVRERAARPDQATGPGGAVLHPPKRKGRRRPLVYCHAQVRRGFRQRAKPGESLAQLAARKATLTARWSERPFGIMMPPMNDREAVKVLIVNDDGQYLAGTAIRLGIHRRPQQGQGF